MVREFVKKHMCSITTFALTLVATGMASKCCYFMFYQPEVPEDLKKFSKYIGINSGLKTNPVME